MSPKPNTIQVALGLILVAAMVFIGLYPAQAQVFAFDFWEGAEEITSLPYYSGNFNTTSATNSADDPWPTCSETMPTNTVWFKYTPHTTALLQGWTRFNTYSNVLAVYTRTDIGFSEIGCIRNGWLRFTPEADTTYYFMIGADSSAYPSPVPGGEIALVVLEISYAPNDDFSNATIVESLPFSDSQEITVATWENGEQISSCNNVSNPTSIWYVLTPAEDGVLTGHLEVTSDYYPYWALWTGSELGNLSEVACNAWYADTIDAHVRAGTTYFLQIGSRFTGQPHQGVASLSLDFIPPPPNDEFINALSVESLPFSFTSSNQFASIQPGEPSTGCAWEGIQRTVWFAYTPIDSRSVTARLPNSFWYNYIAVYTGDGLQNLSELRCSNYVQYNPLTIYAQAGTTYYFQVGSLYGWDYGNYTFELDYTPPPEASFAFSPNDPSIFDVITFWDTSYDPVGQGVSDSWWNFGDGASASGVEVTHQCSSDDDYTVWHKMQTPDGRTAEVTQVIQVRTHDVAITKFSPPQSARLGQTKAITVGLRNTRYPETAVVELYKSTPNGFVYVGSLEKTVPVRPSNRTTDIVFNYTFTSEDAMQGKITFKAIATIQGYRDALTADNEAIALPTIVRR